MRDGTEVVILEGTEDVILEELSSWKDCQPGRIVILEGIEVVILEGSVCCHPGRIVILEGTKVVILEGTEVPVTIDTISRNTTSPAFILRGLL